MKISIRVFLSTSVLLLFCGTNSEAQKAEWSRFRGSDGFGVDKFHSAPVSWDSTDFLWSVTLPGSGNSSPVVWGEKIFVTSSDDEKDAGYVIAVDEKEGEILWKKEFQVGDLDMHPDNDLAAPSAAVDESQIYVVWYSKKKTILMALDHDGNLQWQTEFGGIVARHGGGSSVMLTDSYVVFTREQEVGSSFSSSWVAVEKHSGNTAWELERESAEGNSFSTPVLIDRGKRDSRLLFTSQAHGFTGVDPKTGQVQWERKDMLSFRVVSSPVYSNGYIVGSRKGEGVVIKYDPEADQIADTALYRIPRIIAPYVPTPIIVDSLLFLFVDVGSVACIQLSTGEMLWKEKPAGPIYGSPICVEGTLFCQTRQGKVLIIPAEASYTLKGIIDLGEGSSSTPAMCSQGMLFRTDAHLFLLGNTEK